MEKGAREEAYTGKKACDEADRREKWEDERRYQALGKRKEKKTNVFNRKTCETTILNEPILCKLKDADKAHS